MVLLVHRHGVRDVEETNLAWTKCLDVLTSLETGSRTARRCLKVLQLSNSCFLTREPPFFPEPSTDRSKQDAVLPTIHQVWPGDSNAYPPPALGEVFEIPDNRDRLPDQGGDLTTSWMNEQIDLAWLSAVPFDLGADDWTAVSM